MTASDEQFAISLRVENGELTPEDAEILLKERGLPPIVVSPDPGKFDPNAEANWTLVMALAWIIWRTPVAVREMWDVWRSKIRYWADCPSQDQTGRKRRVLMRKRPAGLWHLDVLNFEGSVRMIKGRTEAFDLLSEAAQSAKWRASGLPTNGGPRCEIPPVEWLDLYLCEAAALPFGPTRRVAPLHTTVASTQPDELGHLAVLRDSKRGALEFGYDDVHVPRAGIIGAFPAAGASVTSRLRGDLPKVEAAIKNLWPAGLPAQLSDADVIKAVGNFLQQQKAKVPDPKTIRRHLKRFRDGT